MRLAFVTETYPPEINGVALTVHSLVEQLRQRGNHVEVTRPRQPSDVADLRDDEFRVASQALPRYPGLRFGWPAGRALRMRWSTARPDAVYVATEGPLGFSALRAACALGIPVLTGFHTRFDQYLSHYGAAALEPIANAWLRSFHNRAHATLVPTPALQDELTQRGIRNAMLLPRAIDGERFAPSRRSEALRESWGLAPSDLAVLNVGRLAPEKNLELLVAAFRAIAARRTDAKLVIVGDGPALGLLREAVPEAVFCGLRTGVELATHYASADLFVFPSLSETYGNVTLEALASGVPVVAFAQGAAFEYVRNGRSGITVPPDDPVSFVEACVALGEQRASRSALAEGARAEVLKLHPRQVAIDFEYLVRRFTPRTDANPLPVVPLAATQNRAVR